MWWAIILGIIVGAAFNWWAGLSVFVLVFFIVVLYEMNRDLEKEKHVLQRELGKVHAQSDTHKNSKTLFMEASKSAEHCLEEIKRYGEAGGNPFGIAFTAEHILFNTLNENITRLKIKNIHNENELRKIALAFSDYIRALEAIMNARVYLSVDMSDNAYETMGKKIYQPRMTIEEITRYIKGSLGSDYTDPGTLIPEKAKTTSSKSLYSYE